MAKSESIAATYEGFAKAIDKLQQLMNKAKEVKKCIIQRRKEVEEDWSNVGLKVEYLVMKLSESIEELCENAYSRVKVSTHPLIDEGQRENFSCPGPSAPHVHNSKRCLCPHMWY